MKITYKQLLKLIQNTSDQNMLRSMLKHIFTYEENLDIFSYYFFPHACTAKTPEFHKEIYKWLFEDGNGALAAPRGHAKSTLVGVFFLIFTIVNKLDEYIVYTSANYGKTMQFIEPLMEEFENNERLKFVYGDMKPAMGKDEHGKFREDIIDVNKIRVQGASFEQNIRGFKYIHKRPTLIILDDIEDDQRVLNPELRHKDARKLNNIIIPSLDIEKGRVKFIGTVLHHDSLLIQKIRLHNGKIYVACDENFQNRLWPTYWTEARLRKKHHDIGSTPFESEYRNNPIDNVASLIKREWMKDCCDLNLTYHDAEVEKYDFRCQGVDFAFSDRVTADKSAFVAVGKSTENYTVFSCITKKGMSITEQFDYIEYLSGIMCIDDNALEENSMRSMSKELKNYNFSCTLFWTSASDTAKKRSWEPEYDNKRHTLGKTAMINRLATQFENHRIRLPYMTDADKKITNQIIDECGTYSLSDGKLVETGVHGDIPIALCMALERCEMETFEFVGGVLEI